MRTRDIKEIELDAKLWTDSYGITYHSCNIYVNDVRVHRIDYAYGYGNHYETVAFQWLTENLFSKQLVTKIGWSLSVRRLCKEVIKCKFKSNSQVVNRKKDL